MKTSSGVSCKIYFLVVPKVECLGKDRCTKPLNSSSCSKGPVSHYCFPSLRRQKTVSRKNILLNQKCFPVSNFNMDSKSFFTDSTKIILFCGFSGSEKQQHLSLSMVFTTFRTAAQAPKLTTWMTRFALCFDFQFISASTKSLIF